MSFIDVIPPEAAEGELAEFYQRVSRSRGNVANVHQVASLHPPLAQAHLDLYMSLMYDRKAGLDRRTRELIATAVSWANDCAYCVTHHSEALAKYLKDDELLAAIVEDPEAARLSAADRALVDYALKLTRTPSQVRREDTDALREAGFEDADILNAAAVTGYFNFVNRLVLGLGTEVEHEDERDYDY